MFKLDKVAKQNTTTFIDYLSLQKNGQQPTLYSLRGRVHILEQANWKIRFCAWLGCGLKGDDNKKLIENSVNYLVQQGKNNPKLYHQSLVILGFKPENLFSDDPNAPLDLKPLSYHAILANYNAIHKQERELTDAFNQLSKQNEWDKLYIENLKLENENLKCQIDELATGITEQTQEALSLAKDKDLQNDALQADLEATTLHLEETNTELDKTSAELERTIQDKHTLSTELTKVEELLRKANSEIEKLTSRLDMSISRLEELAPAIE